MSSLSFQHLTLLSLMSDSTRDGAHRSVGIAWLCFHGLLTGPSDTRAAISPSLLGLLPQSSPLRLVFSLIFLSCTVLLAQALPHLPFSPLPDPSFSRWRLRHSKKQVQPWTLKGFPGAFIHSFIHSFKKTFPEHLLVSSTVLDLRIWHEQHKVPALVELTWWRWAQKNKHVNNNNKDTNNYAIPGSANFLERHRECICE